MFTKMWVSSSLYLDNYWSVVFTPKISIYRDIVNNNIVGDALRTLMIIHYNLSK